VTPRRSGRTQSCGRLEAENRLRDARAHLQVAELPGSGSPAAELKAAISSAVLAGIAAADAACCQRLGHRSRSQDHRDAVSLVRNLAPGGGDAAKRLERLLAMKDESRYGFGDVGAQKHERALRHAGALVAFAARHLER
jgi:hypothetical protein